MKPIEVFVKYCKIKHIMPEMKGIVGNKYIKWYTYNSFSCMYEYSNADFKTLVNNVVKDCGFKLVFHNVEKYFNRTCNKEEYLKAKRTWEYFVKNNIKVKNPIQKGDKVTVVLYDNRTEADYYFDDFYIGYETVILTSEIGAKVYMSPNNIRKVNDKEFRMDYYIKWKGKEYGID